jgi:hypothetical protein
MSQQLDVSKVSVQEAANRLIQELSTLNFSNGDKEIVCFTQEGHELRYKLSEVLQHVKNVLEGKDDPIGLREIHYMRLQIAYERGSRR